MYRKEGRRRSVNEAGRVDMRQMDAACFCVDYTEGRVSEKDEEDEMKSVCVVGRPGVSLCSDH